MLRFSADLKIHRLVKEVFAWLADSLNQGTFDKSSLKGELRMKGFARLLEPLIGRQMRSKIDRQFADLPRLMEAEIPEGVHGKVVRS